MGSRTGSVCGMGKLVEAAFKSAERRDAASKQIIETEYAASAEKTRKLRALRLAKERAADSAKKQKSAACGSVW